MLLLVFVLLFLVGSCLILLLPAIWGGEVYSRYREGRTVDCPETHAPVSVRFNALRAAWSGLMGKPKLRLADCTRWPERSDCGQECIPDALRANAAPPMADVPWRTGRVVHLPVLLAAWAAWVLGMAWHSEYLFRPQWMMALGLSDRQTRDLARMWTPHLLTAGACLLFAYGVAGLLRWLGGSRTLGHGIEVSFALWLLIGAAVMTVAWEKVAPALFWIEGGYTFLGALLVGAIVGGVPRWLFVGDPRERGEAPPKMKDGWRSAA
jgi:hypothetical protein